jgi:hypothetical protein
VIRTTAVASESGIVAEAFAAVRRSPLAILAVAALAIVPAHLLANAVDYVGAKRIEAEIPPTRGERVADRGAELADRSPAPVSPEANAAERRDVLRQAAGSSSPYPLRLRFGRGVAQAIAVGILFAGLLFAQAALTPLAFGQGGAGFACAAVGSRLGSICAAASAGAVLVAIGILCLVVPGIVIAILFFFAGPAALAEPKGGFAALQRSVRLFGRVWPEAVALVFVTAGIDVGLHELAFRLLPSVRPIPAALVDAAISALVLPFPLLLSSILYLRARSAADGIPIEELRQYMRRICAPG